MFIVIQGLIQVSTLCMKGDCNFVLYSLDRDVHIKKVHTLAQ